MALRYDVHAEAYVGERYRVEQSTFMRSLTGLLDAGWNPEEALDWVLNEDNWSPALRGVRPIVQAPRCRRCGTSLPDGRGSYCNVVCEAIAHLRQCIGEAASE